MLLTKYANQMPAVPLSEYPRPQFRRSSYVCLNGTWKCAFTNSSQLPKAFPIDILVPFSPETPLSGVGRMLGPREYLHYMRTFTLEPSFNRGRVLLHFGAVDQTAEVFVNGKSVAFHVGGYTPFSADITDALCDGENTLCVTVQDFTDTQSFSRGKQKMKRGQIWYSPQSGIWQSVWLESVPVAYLQNVKITPDYDGASVHFEVQSSDAALEAEIVITDASGAEVARGVTKAQKLTMPMGNFHAWSPEDPYLYRLHYTAGEDVVDSYFAMRKFSYGRDKMGIMRFFLNGKPYFLTGVLDQGYYPDGYLTPPSEKALENDVRIMKKMGFNMLRKHIKIEPLSWYYYCDKYGMIVLQDMVNGGDAYGLEVSVLPFVGINLDDTNYKNFHREDAYGRQMYDQELEETVNLLYNCPCIAVWVPFNEGWGQFDSVKYYEKLKAMDPTRLVDTASGWHDRGMSDFKSEHIYFTPIRVHNLSGSRPYLLSEFGGYSQKISGHTFGNKMFGYKIFFSKSVLEKAFERLYSHVLLPQIKGGGLAGCVYTQLSDVEDELNGLLTYDRKVLKIDPALVRAVNEKLKKELEDV